MLAFLISSVFKIGVISILFVGYVVLLYRKELVNLRVSKFSLSLIIVFIITLGTTFIYLENNDIPSTVKKDIYLNLRYYFIQLSFAIALYEYLKIKPLKFTLDVLLLGVIANIIVGVWELSKADFQRIQMLFPEPSSAGYYYLFIFFILMKYYKVGWKFYITRFFMLLGLAIGSKIQYLLLFILGALKYSTPQRFIIFSISIFSILYIYRAEINSLPIVKYNLYVLNTYLEGGLQNFKESNRIWGTYVTRVSGIEGAIKCLYQNPFGIGSGYGVWFTENMNNTGIDNTETNRVIAEYAATARSNLLDLFLRTGVIGLFIYSYWAFVFYKARLSHDYIYKAFIIFTFASLFTELNPMFTYLAILMVLVEKKEIA